MSAILSISEISSFPQSATGHTYKFPEVVERLRNLNTGSGIAVRFVAEMGGPLRDTPMAPKGSIQGLRNDIGALKKETGGVFKTKLEQAPARTEQDGRPVYVFTFNVMKFAQEDRPTA